MNQYRQFYIRLKKLPRAVIAATIADQQTYETVEFDGSNWPVTNLDIGAPLPLKVAFLGDCDELYAPAWGGLLAFARFDLPSLDSNILLKVNDSWQDTLVVGVGEQLQTVGPFKLRGSKVRVQTTEERIMCFVDERFVYDVQSGNMLLWKLPSSRENDMDDQESELDGEGSELDGEGSELDGEGSELDGEGSELDGEGSEPDGEGSEPDDENNNIDDYLFLTHEEAVEIIKSLMIHIMRPHTDTFNALPIGLQNKLGRSVVECNEELISSLTNTLVEIPELGRWVLPGRLSREIATSVLRKHFTAPQIPN
jgi:hypothetical protein